MKLPPYGKMDDGRLYGDKVDGRRVYDGSADDGKVYGILSHPTGRIHYENTRAPAPVAPRSAAHKRKSFHLEIVGNLSQPHPPVLNPLAAATSAPFRQTDQNSRAAAHPGWMARPEGTGRNFEERAPIIRINRNERKVFFLSLLRETSKHPRRHRRRLPDENGQGDPLVEHCSISRRRG